MIMFGMITAAGLSNLQFVDRESDELIVPKRSALQHFEISVNSPRNLFIVGFSIFFALVIDK